jgi:FkbM family methyltransferase
VGAYAIPLAKAFSNIEVHAFEPNPFAVERLRKNLTLNGVENLVLHPYAVGAQPGRMDLHAFADNDLGLSSLVSPPKEGSRNIPVEVITLDDFYRTTQRRISLIKIDVQGYEFQVLQGGRNLIQKKNPYILLDHEDDLFPKPLGAEEAKQNLQNFFSQCGYAVFHMSKFDPFMLFPVSWKRPLFGTLLAIPQASNPQKE